MAVAPGPCTSGGSRRLRAELVAVAVALGEDEGFFERDSSSDVFNLQGLICKIKSLTRALLRIIALL